MDLAVLGMDIDSRPVKRTNAELDTFAAKGRQAATTAGKVESSTGKMAAAYKGAATKIAMVTAAVAAMGSTIKVLADYDRQISKVAAVSRATADEISAMRSIAAKLGATTEFTGKQAAQGLEFLARAGFSAADAIEAIPAVLNLATAAALDLGTAADISSNIMSAFGIDATDAAQAADVLAAASSRSNTDVLQLGDAMKYVGPVADAMNVSMQDTAAAIGVLSDAGIQGSLAGTSLRRILSSLANTTPEASSTLLAMGVAMSDIEPTTHSLVEIVQTLSDAGINAADALTIFGDRGGPAILALTKNNARLAELTGIMQDVDGEATTMANTMRDNLGGDIDGLWSSVQGLILALGDAGLTFLLRETIQLVTGLTRAFTGLISGVDAIVTKIFTYNEAEEQRKAALDASNTALQTQIDKGTSVEEFMKTHTATTLEAANAQLSLAEATLISIKAEADRQDVIIKSSGLYQISKRNELNINKELNQLVQEELDAKKYGHGLDETQLEYRKELYASLLEEMQTQKELLATHNAAREELEKQQKVVDALKTAIADATGEVVHFGGGLSTASSEATNLANGLGLAAGQASLLSSFLDGLPGDLQSSRESIAGLKAGLSVLSSSGDKVAASVAQYRAELLASVGPLNTMQDGQREFVQGQIDAKVALFDEEQKLRAEWTAQTSTLTDLKTAATATTVTLADLTTQSEGFAFAIEQAGVSAAEFGSQQANVMIGGIDGVSSAWGNFVGSGFSDFQGFVDSVLNSFKGMIVKMITMATRNKIMLSLGFSGVPGASFADMAGNGTMESLLPGIFGNGGMVQGLSMGLGGVLSGGGLGSSFANLGGLLSGGASWGALGAAIPAIGLLAAGISLLIPRTKELDAGLRITANGMDSAVETFSKIEKSRLFGLIKSQSTNYTSASADIADPITLAIAQIQLASVDAAAAIGLGADAFDGFTAQLSVSTKGLTDSEALAAVTEQMNNLADSFAEAALEGAGVVRVGEGAAATLSALATSLTSANEAFDRLGLRPYDLTVAGADAARSLMDAFGGVDAFSQSISTYFSTYYSDGEQLDVAMQSLQSTLSELGISTVPATHAQFRMLVDAFRQMGDDAGFAALVKVAPLFDEIATSIEDNLSGALQDAQDNLDAANAAATSAYETAVQTIEAHRDELVASWNTMLTDMATAVEQAASDASTALDYASTIFDARNAELKAAFDAVSDSLGDLIDSSQTRVQDLNSVVSILQSGVSTRLGQSSKSARSSALSLIQSGDVSNLTDLRSAVTTLNADSKDLFSSRADWKADFAKTTAAMQSLHDSTASQLSTEEQTLAALEQQLADEKTAYEASIAYNDAQLTALENQLDALTNIDSSLQAAITAIYGANADASAIVSGAVFDQSTITDYVRAAILELATAQEEEKLLQSNATTQIAAAQADAAQQISALQDSVAGILQLDTSIQTVSDATGDLQVAIADLTSAQFAMSTAEQSYAQLTLDQQTRQAELLDQILLRSEEAARAQAITKLQDELYTQFQSIGEMPQLLEVVGRQFVRWGASYVTLNDGTRFSSTAGIGWDEVVNAENKANAYIADRQAQYDEWSHLNDLYLEPLRDQIRALGGVPAFDAGGYHKGGRARIGENDIELVAPSRIYSGEETRSMLDNSKVVEALDKLNAEVAQLREENRQLGIRASTDGNKVRKLLEKFDSDGLPATRVIA